MRFQSQARRLGSLPSRALLRKDACLLKLLIVPRLGLLACFDWGFIQVFSVLSEYIWSDLAM